MIKRSNMYVFLVIVIGSFFFFISDAKAACTLTGSNWGKEPPVLYLNEDIAYTITGNKECGGKIIVVEFWDITGTDFIFNKFENEANTVTGGLAEMTSFQASEFETRRGDQTIYFKAYAEDGSSNTITSRNLTLKLEEIKKDSPIVPQTQKGSTVSTNTTPIPATEEKLISRPSWRPVVQCGLKPPNQGGTAGLPASFYQPCQRCDIFKLGKNIIDFIMFGLIPPVAVLLFTWAGFLILISGGQGKGFIQGKTIFRNTFFGFLLIMLSWVVTNTIIRSIATDNVAKNWWEFQCQEKEFFGAVEAKLPESTSGETKPSEVCLSSGEQSNLCSLTPVACSNSKCGQYVGSVNRYAGGAATANLLKAIMVSESSCDISQTTGTSYGLMMLSPDSITPIMKSACQVNTEITPAWLTSPSNADKSICLAAQFINSLVPVCGNSARNLAAGYNGGIDACNKSVDCAGEISCDGSPTRKWECLYDNIEHTICNKDRPNTSYAETRKYAPKVVYCVANPGF